jgi:hypothetical protein
VLANVIVGNSPVSPYALKTWSLPLRQEHRRALLKAGCGGDCSHLKENT